jgi:hypothetical protein
MRQTAEDRTVSVGQKKVFNHLVVLGDLLNQRQQLLDLDQHQTGLGTRCHGISSQMRLMQGLEDLSSGMARIGMSCLAQGRFDRKRQN